MVDNFFCTIPSSICSLYVPTKNLCFFLSLPPGKRTYVCLNSTHFFTEPRNPKFCLCCSSTSIAIFRTFWSNRAKKKSFAEDEQNKNLIKSEPFWLVAFPWLCWMMDRTADGLTDWLTKHWRLQRKVASNGWVLGWVRIPWLTAYACPMHVAAVAARLSVRPSVYSTIGRCIEHFLAFCQTLKLLGYISSFTSRESVSPRQSPN